MQLRHQLPHRLRFSLAGPIEPWRLDLISWHLLQLDQALVVRLCADRCGVVVVQTQDRLICPALVANGLLAALAEGAIHGPALPPAAWQLWLGGTRQLSIRLLMALAIAGWALPILPGTPFFLLAWWLGWRPEPKDSSAEAKPQPALAERSA